MLLYVANLNCFNAEGIIWRGKVFVKAKYAITISHMSKFSTFSTSLSCQLVVQDERKFLTKMESHFLSLQVSPQNVVTSLVMNCLVCLYCFCLLITYQWKCFESFRKLQFNSVNFVTHELVCRVWLCILIFFQFDGLKLFNNLQKVLCCQRLWPVPCEVYMCVYKRVYVCS